MLSKCVPQITCAHSKVLRAACYGDGPSPPSPVLDGCHIMDGILLPKQFADSESSLLELVSDGVEGLAQLHTANREIESTGEGAAGDSSALLCTFSCQV